MLLLNVAFLSPVKVQNFNKERPEPDVSQEERSHGYPSNSHAHPLCTETGFRYVSHHPLLQGESWGWGYIRTG